MLSRSVEPQTTETELNQLFVEALESRIAPATFVVGNPSDGGTMNYTTPGTEFNLASASADPVIAALFSGSTSHYYIDLGAKDQMFLATADIPANFINVIGGRALAFFHDIDADNIVDANELTGLSLGAATNIAIGYSVNGDILTSLDAKTGLMAPSLIGDAQTIKKLTLNGDAVSIIAGGAITDISASGVGLIGTGTVGDGYNFDFGGGAGVGQGEGTLNAIVLAAKKAGPSISKVVLSSVGSIIASDGGAGGAGGSISLITIQNDTNGFTIQAGDGMAAVGTGVGGAGGKISSVVVQGKQDFSLDDLITIKSGNGGMGGGTGAGGAGGLIEKIYVGYDQTGTTTFSKSDKFLADRVEVLAGIGGVGKTGGAGGSLSNINVRVAPAGALADAIHIAAGDGGNSNDAAGKGGAGGKVTSYFLLDNFAHGPVDPYSKVVVEAGTGGAGGSTGGIGGLVSAGVILAKSIEVNSGDGGNGTKTGAAAGLIENLQIAYPTSPALIQNGQPESNIVPVLATEVVLRAGAGGDATAGNGGVGGLIRDVSALQTDLAVLTINAMSGGNGGDGVGGNGGAGGAVSNVQFGSDADSLLEVAATLRSGDGGLGTKKGGVGGNFTSSSFQLTDASFVFSSGAGGNSSAGAGGNAGLVNGLTLVTTGMVGGLDASVQLTAGVGGNAGLKTKAGSGGSLTGLSVEAPGLVSVASGNGGEAATGGAGAGGAISTATVISQNSSASLVAGSGGAGGGTPSTGGLGGSISNANVQALVNVSVVAGDGTFGGAGGDIKTAFVGGVAGNSFVPLGNVLVSAGDGANGAKTGGKGGSLSSITSFSSDDALFGTAVFTAGQGGNGATAAGGAGGGIATLVIRDGASEFSVVAGDGGDAATKGAGGVGGSVTGFTSLEETLLVRNIVAGDGGNTAQGAKGANGGSVSTISVAGDVGLRTGADFGYNSMGGIFAGNGGTGVTSGGTAGSVLGVSADFVASIVAGRDASNIGLVAKVDGVKLNGLTKLTVNTLDDSFANAPSANYVGGIAGDPTMPAASEFKIVGGSLTSASNPWLPGYVPLDGLVAALVKGSNNNVSFNAWLTNSGSSRVLVSAFNGV